MTTMKQRCQEAAIFYTPWGTKVTYRKALTGRAFIDENRIEAPRPVTRKSLHVYLHEIAHLVLHGSSVDGIPKKRTKRYIEEYQAEVQALDWMREWGIPISQDVRREAKRHVAYCIRKAVNRGAQNIDPAVLRFAGLKKTDLFSNRHGFLKASYHYRKDGVIAYHYCTCRKRIKGIGSTMNKARTNANKAQAEHEKANGQKPRKTYIWASDEVLVEPGTKALAELLTI